MAIPPCKSRLASIPPVVWLLGLTCLCLLPFTNKAVHIDDTLFLRVAQQIQKHPADFYGFGMNWFGSSRPMIENFDNPPLACYYLAFVATFTGWSEPALHLAFLLPALVAAWGTYALARRLCPQPLLASVVAVLTPVFLLSATTLMCDVLLLSFWIWSVVWFERGLDTGRKTAFVISGIFAGLASWTKFTGLALIPLLAFWGLTTRRRAGWWLVALLLPLLFAALYEWATFKLYGKGLLFTAAGVAATSAQHRSIWEREVVGLSFLGGCFLPLLLYVPRLWSCRSTVVGICLCAPCLLLYPYLGRFKLLWEADGRPNWLLVLQSALYITAGLHVLLLATADFLERRDAVALMLVLWVLGVFVFASSLNWTINGRSLLPMAPAVGILVARRLGRRAESAPPHPQRRLWRSLWPAIPAAALSLYVVKVDYDLAGASRTAAAAVAARYPPPGKTLWFEGHWGFQYYMEQHQAKALEWPFQLAAPGDLVVAPSEAVNTFDISTNLVRLIDILDYRPNPHCSTMSLSAGAGFYAGVCGPFPFSLGRIDSERYYIFEVTQTFEAALKAPGGISPVGAITQQFDRERAALAQPAGTRPTMD